MPKTAIVLINLGTPDAPTTKAVRRFLKEFLSDPSVIHLPKIYRWFLLHFLILPLRSPRSAHAYQKIWRDEGSPLLYFSQTFADLLQQQLGNDYVVALAMRYGSPNLETTIKTLLEQYFDKIIFLPLFPHAAIASTGSAIKKILGELMKYPKIPAIEIKSEFFELPQFIQSYATVIEKHINHNQNDFILFSYHGLPEKFLNKDICEKIKCDSKISCTMSTTSLHACYRAQCYKTTELIAKQLSLKTDQYATSFQSRLGYLPWIKPYTFDTLENLAAKKIKNLTVVCPSFVTDCLETLEEIGIRAKERWLQLGGNSFTLIPALNGEEIWVKAVASIIKESGNS